MIAKTSAPFSGGKPFAIMQSTAPMRRHDPMPIENQCSLVPCCASVSDMTTVSLPAQIARTGRFTLRVPGQFAVGPDGAEALLLRARVGDDPVACLWAVDLDSGTEGLLADPAELLAGEPAGRGDDIGGHDDD